MPKAARKSEGGKREQAMIGTHAGRLLGIVDMGHQPPFQAYESQWKFEFTYELVCTQMEDGRPFVVSEQLNNNDWEDIKSGKSTTLVARAKALLGPDYKEGLKDLTKLLGNSCMVTVTHNDKGYAQVKGAGAVGSTPMGFEVPALQNPTYFFDMVDLDQPEEPDMELWDRMPDFKKERLQQALNFNETKLAKILAEGDEYK